MATRKTTHKKITDLFLTLSKSQQISILEDLEELRVSLLHPDEYIEDMDKVFDDNVENKNKDFDELFGGIK